MRQCEGVTGRRPLTSVERDGGEEIDQEPHGHVLLRNLGRLFDDVALAVDERRSEVEEDVDKEDEVDDALEQVQAAGTTPSASWLFLICIAYKKTARQLTTRLPAGAAEPAVVTSRLWRRLR